MRRNLIMSLSLACLVVLCAGCSRTLVATNFNGLSTPDGEPIAHVSTSNLAIHLLGSQPLVGNATLMGTMDDFTKAVKEENGTNVRVVQSKVFNWWFLFPPFSFVLTPVTSNVAGDVLP